jgi:hypothetical protein
MKVFQLFTPWSHKIGAHRLSETTPRQLPAKTLTYRDTLTLALITRQDLPWHGGFQLFPQWSHKIGAHGLWLHRIVARQDPQLYRHLEPGYCPRVVDPLNIIWRGEQVTKFQKIQTHQYQLAPPSAQLQERGIHPLGPPRGCSPHHFGVDFLKNGPPPIKL